MKLKNRTICPRFTVMVSEKSIYGIIVIQFKNHATGKTECVEIDIYSEMLVQADSPFHRVVLMNLLSNKGFLISPIPGALEEFLHMCLFPEDAMTSTGEISVEPLPKDAEVEFLSSNETVKAIHQEAA